MTIERKEHRMDIPAKNILKKALTLALFLVVLFTGAQAQGGGAAGGARGGGGMKMPGVSMNFIRRLPDDDLPLPDALDKYTATDLMRLVRRTDITSSFYDTDMTATITMVSVDPDKGTLTRKNTIYRRDRDDAFVMVTLEPKSRKGQGIMRVDNNMWRYDPKSRKFTHTTLKDSYEETTTRNSDFRRSQRSLDYQVGSFEQGTLGKYPVWIATLEAVSDEVPFPTIKMWIERDRTIVLKVEEYSVSEKLLRTAYYTNYVQIGESFVPSTQIFQDGLVPEKRTQTTYTDISTKAVPDDVFSKSFLERSSL
ncbi:MAG: outer membrane lipoprotein-sorting protein [Spirochaetaceae bacterium]|nr:outer membrane lipoprotein-sorting protein [Spirochaetaceae bacterium]